MVVRGSFVKRMFSTPSTHVSLHAALEDKNHVLVLQVPTMEPVIVYVALIVVCITRPLFS